MSQSPKLANLPFCVRVISFRPSQQVSKAQDTNLGSCLGRRARRIKRGIHMRLDWKGDVSVYTHTLRPAPQGHVGHARKTDSPAGKAWPGCCGSKRMSAVQDKPQQDACHQVTGVFRLPMHGKWHHGYRQPSRRPES